MASTSRFQLRLDDMNNGGLKRKKSIWPYDLESRRPVRPFKRRVQQQPEVSSVEISVPSRREVLLPLAAHSALRTSGQGNGNSVDIWYSPRSMPSAGRRYDAFAQVETPSSSNGVHFNSTHSSSMVSVRIPETALVTRVRSDRDFAALLDDSKRENACLRQQLKAREEDNIRTVEILDRESKLKLKLKEMEVAEYKKLLLRFRTDSSRRPDAMQHRREAIEGSHIQQGPRFFQGEPSSSTLNTSFLRDFEGSTDVVSPPAFRTIEEHTSSGSPRPIWMELHDNALDPKKGERMRMRGLEIQFLELLRKKPAIDRTLVDAFTQLSGEAESAVDEALGGLDRNKVLAVHAESNIDVTRVVMQCLLPGAWLNDEVINVYMELLKERELREPDRFLKCHFFNTFFYNKLYKDKLSYDYKAIRRWTTQKRLGYSLSSCDKILVPIHQDVHWCLAVVNIHDKKFEYLDSLKGKDGAVLDVLARYIADEVSDKDGKVLDVSAWKHDFPQDIPEQMNGCDCGVFMVKYADFHSRGAHLQFSQEHMEYFRRKMVWEILQLKAT